MQRRQLPLFSGPSALRFCQDGRQKQIADTDPEGFGNLDERLKTRRRRSGLYPSQRTDVDVGSFGELLLDPFMF